jgi:hypothetical protein
MNVWVAAAELVLAMMPGSAEEERCDERDSM